MKRGSGLWLIIAVLFIVFLVYLGYHSKGNVDSIGNKFSAQKDAEAIAADIGNCGIIVSSPAPNSVVSFPLMVKTIVDNTDMDKRGCAWSTFEAHAGTVKVINSANIEVGSGVLMTTEDWMTSGPVHYSGEVKLTGTPADKNLKLIFTEDNPNDDVIPNTFTLNVKIP